MTLAKLACPVDCFKYYTILQSQLIRSPVSLHVVQSCHQFLVLCAWCSLMLKAPWEVVVAVMKILWIFEVNLAVQYYFL